MSSSTSNDGNTLGGKKALIIIIVLLHASFTSSLEITAYDFGQVVSTKIYSLYGNNECEGKTTTQNITLTSGSILMTETRDKNRYTYCMFEASYTVAHMKKSKVWDDGLYLHDESRILPTFYPLSLSTCKRIWNSEYFSLPGFGDSLYLIESTTIKEILDSQGEMQKTIDYAKTFMKAGNKKGIGYAEPVDWITPLGEKIRGSILINGRIVLGTTWGSARNHQGSQFTELTDPLGNKQIVYGDTDEFEKDSVNYMLNQDNSCKFRTLVSFTEKYPGYQYTNNNTKVIFGSIQGKEARSFSIEINPTRTEVCEFSLYKSTIPGIFYSNKTLQLNDLQHIEITPELMLSSRLEFVNFWNHLERNKLVTKLARHECLLRKIEIKQIRALTANVDSPVLSLSTRGTHIERAGGVVYYHRCAKMRVRLTALSFCTEEVPVLIGTGNETIVRYMHPISRIVFSNFTVAKCNPMFPNLLRLDNGSWIEYGKQISLSNIEPLTMYYPEHRDDDPILASLRAGGFFTQEDVETSHIARLNKHARTVVNSREVFKTSEGKYNHESFYHLNFPDKQLGFNWKSIALFDNVKNETLETWWLAREATLTVMTICFIFAIMRGMLKAYYLVRLWTLGAPKSQVVTLMNPITRIESKRQCQKLKHLKEIKRENMYQSFIQLQKKPMLYHNATQTGSRIDLEVQLENEVINDTDSNEECT